MNSLTANIALAVDGCDTFSYFGRLECGSLACRSRADDCDVVKLSLDYSALMNSTIELISCNLIAIRPNIIVWFDLLWVEKKEFFLGSK